MALSLLFMGTVGNAKVNSTGDESSDAVEAVDLGLSVKWANMNVGATKDSGFGSYFAWGEVKPKQFYSWGTYVWSKGDTQYPLKYTTTDRKTQLVPSDDAARTNWGGEWRMPTVDEFEELTDLTGLTEAEAADIIERGRYGGLGLPYMVNRRLLEGGAEND